MRRAKPLTALIAAAALFAIAHPSARADEYYACEDGRLIRVKVGELEKMKNKEPCVAAHFAKQAIRNASAAPTRKSRRKQMASSTSGPALGTRFPRELDGERHDLRPALAARPTPKTPPAAKRPILRGPAGTADEVLPPPEAPTAEAKAKPKLEGRLADARIMEKRAATSQAHPAPSAGKHPPTLRILNAKPRP